MIKETETIPFCHYHVREKNDPDSLYCSVNADIGKCEKCTYIPENIHYAPEGSLQGRGHSGGFFITNNADLDDPLGRCTDFKLMSQHQQAVANVSPERKEEVLAKAITAYSNF